MRKSLGKEVAFLSALILTACSQTSNVGGVGVGVELVTPTPKPTPTPEPAPTPMSELDVETHAGNNFLILLNQMERSENPIINSLPQKFYDHQRDESITSYTSKPEFDSEGRVVRDSRTPMRCGLDDSGKYIILINTNAYFFDNTFPMEVTAAHIDECITLYDNIRVKYTEFSNSYPGGDFLDAMQNHPEWLDAAISQAWFLTTRDILIPNRDKMPEGNNLYNQLIAIYEKSGGDFTKWDEEMRKVPETAPSYQA